MLGMLQHPHHAQFVPRFCKNYASVGEEVRYRFGGEGGPINTKQSERGNKDRCMYSVFDEQNWERCFLCSLMKTLSQLMSSSIPALRGVYLCRCS